MTDPVHHQDVIPAVRSHLRQRGVTSIEYGLLAALIAVAIIVGVATAGDGNAFNWSGWTSKFLAAINK